MNTRRRLGVMFDRERPPEELVEAVWTAEVAGMDEFWVVEDLGWNGGLTAAATALAASDKIEVGIGIAPAPLRSPAVLAMEIATLARLHPGRLLPGVGHGVRSWMQQLGVAPASPLALLRETLTALRGLLAGESVTLDGREVQLVDIRLRHPARQQPPLFAGVSGPKSLALSGELADGTILVEGTGPQSLARDLAHIEAGRTRAGRTDPHPLVVYTGFRITDDPAEAAAVRAAVVPDIAAMLGVEQSEVFLPMGSVDLVLDAVEQLWVAGADTVVLHPFGDDPAGQTLRIQTAASSGLPLTGRD